MWPARMYRATTNNSCDASEMVIHLMAGGFHPRRLWMKYHQLIRRHRNPWSCNQLVFDRLEAKCHKVVTPRSRERTIHVMAGSIHTEPRRSTARVTNRLAP